jgi:hypothetical protein
MVAVAIVMMVLMCGGMLLMHGSHKHQVGDKGGHEHIVTVQESTAPASGMANGERAHGESQ